MVFAVVTAMLCLPVGVAQAVIAPLGAYRLPSVGTDVFTALQTIDAGQTTGRQTHPGTELGYVLEGEITLSVDGAADKTLKSGDSYMVEDARVREISASMAGGVKLLVTYVVARGQIVTTTLPPE